MDVITLAAFCALLVASMALGFPILIALIGGYALFIAFGLARGFSLRKLLCLSLNGIRTSSPVLVVLPIIGALTGLWRASGTIPALVTLLSPLMTPVLLPLATFLTCSLVSLLMGTAFGTAATAGSVCMTVAAAMGANPLIVGGAALAGSYLGDRNSPVSTSALLVAELTHTDLASNIGRMAKSGAVPILLCCGAYAVLGMAFVPEGATTAALPFSGHFNLSPVALLPAASIIVLAAFRTSTRVNIAVSVVLALLICVFAQGCSLFNALTCAVVGYSAPDPTIAALLNGGGIASMLKALAIITVAATYAELLTETGLLMRMQKAIAHIAQRTNPETATVAGAIITSGIACNQTLAIILTHQLCSELFPSRSDAALALEDTVITAAPLIPWSTAAVTPLCVMGISSAATPFALFLWVLPLYKVIWAALRHSAAPQTDKAHPAKTQEASS